MLDLEILTRQKSRSFTMLQLMLLQLSEFLGLQVSKQRVQLEINAETVTFINYHVVQKQLFFYRR